jgi:hypothetical protein
MWTASWNRAEWRQFHVCICSWPTRSGGCRSQGLRQVRIRGLTQVRSNCLGGEDAGRGSWRKHRNAAKLCFVGCKDLGVLAGRAHYFCEGRLDGALSSQLYDADIAIPTHSAGTAPRPNGLFTELVYTRTVCSPGSYLLGRFVHLGHIYLDGLFTWVIFIWTVCSYLLGRFVYLGHIY